MTEKLLRDLAELDPVDESRIPDSYGPEADRLLTWVLAQPHTVRPTPSRRRLWLLVPAALLLLGAGWWLAQPSESPQWVTCYRAATAGADREVVHADVSEEDPAAMCGRLWEDGQLWEDPVPESLVSCLTETSRIGVVPGSDDEACGALDWVPLDWDASAHDVSLLSAEVYRFHHERTCPTEEEASAFAEEALDEHGLDGWEVAVTRPPSREEPCMSIAVAADEEQLHLVPLPSSPDS